MNLSYKDLQFIREAIANLIKTYEKRLDVTEDEDEASDLGNDCKFLEALGRDIEQTLERSVSRPDIQPSDVPLADRKDMPVESLKSLYLPELVKAIIQLSLNERLLLVDAITESIRQELTPKTVEDSFEGAGALTGKVASA